MIRKVIGLRLQFRAAYTLLELMLALALLGALMTVAWSLMGTFRDAEQRGWKLSHRIQTIRVAREWLQSDMQQLVQSELQPATPNAKPSRLTGNSLGFTALIAPSIDPLPFLENLMSNPTDAASEFSNGSSSALATRESSTVLSSESDAETAQAPQSLWPAETMEVEYKLTPAEASSANGQTNLLQPTDLSEVQFSLSRRELVDASSLQINRNSPNTLAQSNNLADRILTAQDLYRQTDETAHSNGVAIRETRLDGLTNVKFQYFDGASWKPAWNSDQAGGLPRAIALCFDFPARANMKVAEPRTPRTENEGGLSGPTDLLSNSPSGSNMSFADSALAAIPTAESSSGIESSLTQSALHEVQIVVYVDEQAQSKTPPSSLGLRSGSPVRGDRQ